MFLLNTVYPSRMVTAVLPSLRHDAHQYPRHVLDHLVPCPKQRLVAAYIRLPVQRESVSNSACRPALTDVNIRPSSLTSLPNQRTPRFSPHLFQRSTKTPSASGTHHSLGLRTQPRLLSHLEAHGGGHSCSTSTIKSSSVAGRST